MPVDFFDCLMEETPEATLLHDKGELDLSNTWKLRAAVANALADDRPVIVDLSGLLYIDGSGCRVFEDLHRTSALQKRLLVLAQPSPLMRKLIDLVHLDRLVPIFESIPLARTWCRSHKN